MSSACTLWVSSTTRGFDCGGGGAIGAGGGGTDRGAGGTRGSSRSPVLGHTRSATPCGCRQWGHRKKRWLMKLRGEDLSGYRDRRPDRNGRPFHIGQGSVPPGLGVLDGPLAWPG